MVFSIKEVYLKLLFLSFLPNLLFMSCLKRLRKNFLYIILIYYIPSGILVQNIKQQDVHTWKYERKYAECNFKLSKWVKKDMPMKTFSYE